MSYRIGEVEVSDLVGLIHEHLLSLGFHSPKLSILVGPGGGCQVSYLLPTDGAEEFLLAQYTPGVVTLALSEVAPVGCFAYETPGLLDRLTEATKAERLEEVLQKWKLSMQQLFRFGVLKVTR